jgi:flagellar motor switch protein FliN
MSLEGNRLDDEGLAARDSGRRRGLAEAPAVSGGSPLDVILDIDLQMVVRFGQTEMTVEALTRIGEGSVIDLGRSPHEPVDLLVAGRLMARGEVVVVAGHYGIRIIELVRGDAPDPDLEA